MNFEGSYKLTMSPSGESIEARSPDKTSLEMTRMKEKSMEDVVLGGRLPLEPPDLIPKIGHLNGKASSVRDVREPCARSCERLATADNIYGPLPTHHRGGACNDNALAVNYKKEGESARDGGRLVEKEDVAEAELCRRRWADDAARATSRCLESEDAAAAAERRKVAQRPCPSNEGGNTSEKYGVSFAVREIRGRPLAETQRLLTLHTVASAAATVPALDGGPPQDSPEHLTEATQGGPKEHEAPVRSDASSQTEEDKPGRTREGQGALEREEPREREGSRHGDDDDDDDDEDEDYEEEEDEDKHREDEERKKAEEELEYERLSRDVASQLSPSDKLQGLLVPHSERKKPTDYVAGLFRLDIASRRRNSSKKSDSSASDGSASSPDASVTDDVASEVEKEARLAEALPSSSPYFTTSEPKAKLLTRYTASDGIDSFGLGDSQQLQKKKEELVARLDKKLQVLRGEQLALLDECSANEELGASVSSSVSKLAKPNDAAKYRLHVEEVGKITSLLLGLSGRLARAENALLALSLHHDERKMHESKRDKLREQLEEAKQLKENIDKRSDSMAKTLGQCLSPEEFADYLHFIQMKEKLIVDSREIADKISLGEEQLSALRDAMTS